MDMAEQGTPGGTSEFDGALAPWEWPPDAGFGDLEEIETGPGESDNEFNASLNTWDEYSALVSISGTDSRLPAATDRRASNEDSVVNHGWVETRMGQETRRPNSSRTRNAGAGRWGSASFWLHIRLIKGAGE